MTDWDKLSAARPVNRQAARVLDDEQPIRSGSCRHISDVLQSLMAQLAEKVVWDEERKP